MNAVTIQMPLPVIHAPGPATTPFVPPPPGDGNPPGGRNPPTPAVAAGLLPAVIASLENPLDWHLKSPLPKLTFPYEIHLIEIDPDIIVG